MKINLVFSRIILFPFNGCRGLGADIIHHTIYTFDTIDDFIGDPGHKFLIEMIKICSHTILRCYSPESYYIFVASFIAHHPDSLDWEEYGKSLPYLIIQLTLSEFRDIDLIYLAQNIQFLFGDITEYPDS